jgi:L-lactate dehydrogenase complex protein LldF
LTIILVFFVPFCGHKNSLRFKKMLTPAQKFKASAADLTRDLQHRFFIQKALRGYEVKRDQNKARFASWPRARDAAGAIKWEAINHLDQYLTEFVEKIEARGATVFWAGDGDRARDYIVQLVREKQARHIIKSKTMTSEEIHLNDALEKAGFDVTESDLGEYIVQLRSEPPYHLVFPAMHLNREQISDIFHEKIGSAPTDNPGELTMIARDVMRQKYIRADIGISGANFAIAETGMISITENEGNARLTTSLPRVHVVLMGIEKLLPKMEDLALFLPMLATAGAGQALTGYNTLIGGPRGENESDGPEEMHLVLLDNKRTELLADAEQRDALHCIRCGACLNVCPIFKNVGGHSYGTTYQGPIGSVITPHLRGLQEWKHLSYASSLCGACTEACPVKIDLHHHLLQNRRNAMEEKPNAMEKTAMKFFAIMMNHPRLYRAAIRAGRVLQAFHPFVRKTKLDPLFPWTQNRDFPRLAPRSFKDYWSSRR